MKLVVGGVLMSRSSIFVVLELVKSGVVQGEITFNITISTTNLVELAQL
jgi:hypothetical protein